MMGIRVEMNLAKTGAINSLGDCDEKSACSRKSLLLAAGDVGVWWNDTGIGRSFALSLTAM